jgi:phenylalanyl-tRNA synthetase beta chain
MKIPYSWVREFVTLPDAVTPQRVAEMLTLRTCEVDAVHRAGAGLDDIVIGEVVKADRHPKKDKIKLVKVNVGRGELLPIVCGAPNVAEGQKVAVAVPGAKLPSGLQITERIVHNETSRGMICSEKELGLGDDHDGILVLESEAIVGAKLSSLRSIEDVVIEIDNKSVNHRPDLWGIYGFAREVAAIFGVELRTYPAPRCPGEYNRADSDHAFRIAIDAPERCARYLGVRIENAQVMESPKWMQRRLRLVGARAVSNVVDITNYVMFEIGQPTHAFDLDRIEPPGNLQKTVLVRRAGEGEKIVTLDNQERSLQKDDLVIADAKRAIGIAGVMGGANSEVHKDTKRILLESANFAAVSVRRTAARLGLRSEASARFEKSLDPATTALAAERIVKFVEEGAFGPAACVGGRNAAGELPKPFVTIPLGKSFVKKRLGSYRAGFDDSTPFETLDRLGIRVRDGGGDEVLCDVPSYRATKDLTEPIDLVEEIARMRGYENVEPLPLEAPVVPPPSQGARRLLVRRVEDALLQLGFRGLESYSFLSDALVESLQLQGPFVTLKNSIVLGASRMRRDVLPTLLGLLRRNLELESDLRLFEVGKGYRPDRPRHDAHVGAQPGEPGEVHCVAGAIACPSDGKSDRDAQAWKAGVFHRAKGIVDSLLDALDLRAEFVTFEDGTQSVPALPYIHPRRRILIGTTCGGTHRLLGFLGEIHPDAQSRLGLDAAAVAGFELDLEALEQAVAAAGYRRFAGIPKFPGIRVDVALLAPENLSAEALESLVRSADDRLCRSAALFDIYAGAELGAGKRSVAFHVELRADDRTLTDADEANFLKSLSTKAESLGVALRGWNG